MENPDPRVYVLLKKCTPGHDSDGFSFQVLISVPINPGMTNQPGCVTSSHLGRPA